MERFGGSYLGRSFFSLNYLFNVPVTSPKSVTVFAADPNEQRIVLELNDGKQFFLDDEPKKRKQTGGKTANS